MDQLHNHSPKRYHGVKLDIFLYVYSVKVLKQQNHERDK